MENKKEITTKAVLSMALQVGFSTAITSTLFIVGGVTLDKKMGTAPLFIIIGALLGLAGSLCLVWQIVKPLQKIR